MGGSETAFVRVLHEGAEDLWEQIWRFGAFCMKLTEDF